MWGFRHLHQTQFGTYVYRYTLPKWFNHRFPTSKKTVNLSLRTKDFQVARIRLLSIQSYTAKILWQIQMGGFCGMGEKTIQQLLSEYRNHISYSEPYEQKDVGWDTPMFGQLLDHFEEKLHTLSSADLLDYVKEDFSNIDTLHEKALDHIDKLRDAESDGLLNQRLIQAKTNLSPIPAVTQSQSDISLQNVTKSDVKLSEILASYIESQLDGARPKTSDKMDGHIGYLITVVGDVDVGKFDKATFRKYWKALDTRAVKRLGKNIPVSPQTKNEHIDSCRRFFAHARSFFDDDIKNYFDDRNVKFKVTKKDKTPRLPFDDNDLKCLFSHDVFTKGRFKYPYQYWAPLLGLLTGSRMNEIAQLRAGDIREEDGIYYISHNLSTSDKMIKTNDERDVPIHPKLVELGFIDFVKLFDDKGYQWEKYNDGSHRIFKGLTLDKVNGGYKKNMSRWFNGSFDEQTGKSAGFKYECGIEIPTNCKKDFHSFRHNLATMLQQADVDWNLGFAITGHAVDDNAAKYQKGAGAGYRHGYQLKQMHDAICKVDVADILKNVQPFFDLNGEKKCRNKVKPLSKAKKK